MAEVRPSARRSATRRAPRAPSAGPGEPAAAARMRFRALDRYRVRREWGRYEGTAQRDLFRQLRARFLRRHAGSAHRVLELGPGPGRFTPLLGERSSRRVLLDLSPAMLLEARERFRRSRRGGSLELVRGDAVHPPFGPGSFDLVVALGNPIGFAEEEGGELLDRATRLLAPGGTILLESVAGDGERSRYLTRLPPTATARVLRAPAGWLGPRVLREGFEAEEPRKSPTARFARWGEERLRTELHRLGLELLESIAVAPSLGGDAARLQAASRDPQSWTGLLALEESMGRLPARRAVASALLVAAGRAHATVDPPAAEGLK